MPAPIDSKTWDELVLAADGSFLQSYAWGEFQRRYGRPVKRWCSAAGATAQTLVHTLPAGRTYLFTPGGPLLKNNGPVHSELIDQIQTLATKHQSIFWRYERGGEQYGGLLRCKRPPPCLQP